ncbi:hypothetical protein [Risungbinella massiliensis]|uniref:hypothetical protein n=1 Tax=Risungbinella massiliensis TaxID=1329796 RepID=UPI0005CBD595|nr:hypothetical protein [Risungbinella massiliensis]
MKSRKFSVLLLLVIVSISLVACGGGSAENVVKTVIDNTFGYSESLKPEERYKAITEVLTPEVQQDEYESMPEFLENASPIYTNGIDKPYFIAVDPSQPQSDSFQSFLVHIPASSLKLPPSSKDQYARITLRDLDGWKITEIDSGSKLSSVLENETLQTKLEWKEVEPF